MLEKGSIKVTKTCFKKDKSQMSQGKKINKIITISLVHKTHKL